MEAKGCQQAHVAVASGLSALEKFERGMEQSVVEMGSLK